MPRWARPLVFGWLFLGAVPLALALLLALVAETARGHVFGLAAACVVAGPVPFALGLARKLRGLRRWAAAVPGLFAIAGSAALVAAVPSPRAPGVRGAWAEGPRQWGLSTLLPEVDQLVLGSYLVGYLDPLITPTSAVRIRNAFLSVYRPMAQDPDFARLPTQLTEAYSDGASGQRFIYVPEHAPGERLPCVVFLHGSGGNFQGYLWVWKQMADRGRFVVVAPGFGFGNWQRPGGVEAVLTARTDAERTLPIDPSRFILAGLSNGGRGVVRVIEGDAARTWKAVVLLSAVVDLEPSAAAWRGRPTLVVHGLRDDRIPTPWLEESVRLLREAGATVQTRFDPDQDHFLFFSRRDEVEPWVLEFLRCLEVSPCP